jgi:hypothetical protein
MSHGMDEAGDNIAYHPVIVDNHDQRHTRSRDIVAGLSFRQRFQDSQKK